MAAHILLVEDHEDSRNIISALLNRCGYDVCTAGDCQTAFQLLEDVRFDALLCDIGLPDGSGLGIVTAAKMKQALVSVAMTALGGESDVRKGKEAGFDHYLTKPVDFAELRSILSAIAV